MKRQDRLTLEMIEPTGQVGKDRVELGRKGKKTKRTKRTRRKSCWTGSKGPDMTGYKCPQG
jgi:hypothetical protein